MIGLDTNVLVRYLAQDDPRQAERASRLMEQELTEQSPGFIGLVVLVETVWVLQRLYGATRQEVLQTVRDLLVTRCLVVEARDRVARAVATVEETSCGFADALITATAGAAGCNRVLTFDRGAARAGMTLLGDP